MKIQIILIDFKEVKTLPLKITLYLLVTYRLKLAYNFEIRHDRS